MIRAAADDCYEALLLQATEILALAFDLHCRTENSDLSLRRRFSIDGMADQFFARLSRHICRYLTDTPLSHQADAYLAPPEIDLKKCRNGDREEPCAPCITREAASKNNAERAPKALGDEKLAA